MSSAIILFESTSHNREIHTTPWAQQSQFLRSVCLYMDSGYKDMWCRAEQEGSQDSFLHGLYEALKEGQEWLSPNDSDLWPTEGDLE